MACFDGRSLLTTAIQSNDNQSIRRGLLKAVDDRSLATYRTLKLVDRLCEAVRLREKSRHLSFRVRALFTPTPADTSTLILFPANESLPKHIAFYQPMKLLTEGGQRTS